jgi:P4 family phage/plasmid primase-like protien
MSKIDMQSFGLPGVYYHFMGKSRYMSTEDGSRFTMSSAPWNLKPDEQKGLSEFLDLSLGELMEVVIALGDTLNEQKTTTKNGTPKHVDASWDNIVEIDAKGEPTSLRYSVIGKLLSNDYIRVEDILMKSEHNIAKSISKDGLSREIITRLDGIGMSDLWTPKSYTLVRDHIMAKCEEKTIGQTKGYLPVKNGVIDIKTLELIQTNDIYMSCADVEYDTSAKCPNTEKLLDNAFNPDQKELVLSILGAAISGRKAPFILCLSGKGRNGKSLLREMVNALASSMITTEKIESLHDNFSNQVFLGKRIIWQTEVSSKRDFTDKLKDITGGTSLTVRYKYQNGQIQQEMQSVVIIDTNSPPHLENSQAMDDRLRFIDMPRVFVYELSGASNEVLIDPVLAEAWRDEMPGFLNLILPYAQHFLTTGTLKQDLKVGMEAYNKKSESLSVFIEEWCDVDDSEEVSLSTFCKYYKKFASKNNIASISDGQIRHALKHEYNFMVKGMKVRGVKPRSQAIIEAFG